jgi:uncharacterized protein YegJ (DUF2314 family)
MPLLFLCVILLFSCQKPAEPPVVRDPAKTMQADTADEQMLRIAEDAQTTLPTFFRQLTRAGAGATEAEHFCVKYPFPADEHSGINTEQVWLAGIHFKNGIYYGILANSPRHLSGMKKGDTVMFDMDKITDWMFVRDEKIIGGDSIKYLLEKIPDSQRTDRERELLRNSWR